MVLNILAQYPLHPVLAKVMQLCKNEFVLRFNSKIK